jgi:hypothetical protein
VELKVVIENNSYAIQIPEQVMQEGESFFEKMEQDMSKGWQMNRDWVENPNLLQRCQIAADRLADAIETENDTLATLMAGYIVTRQPKVKEVHVDTDGEMAETRFIER